MALICIIGVSALIDLFVGFLLSVCLPVCLLVGLFVCLLVGLFISLLSCSVLSSGFIIYPFIYLFSYCLAVLLGLVSICLLIFSVFNLYYWCFGIDCSVFVC